MTGVSGKALPCLHLDGWLELHGWWAGVTSERERKMDHPGRVNPVSAVKVWDTVLSWGWNEGMWERGLNAGRDQAKGSPKNHPGGAFSSFSR